MPTSMSIEKVMWYEGLAMLLVSLAFFVGREGTYENPLSKSVKIFSSANLPHDGGVMAPQKTPQKESQTAGNS